VLTQPAPRSSEIGIQFDLIRLDNRDLQGGEDLKKAREWKSRDLRS